MSKNCVTQGKIASDIMWAVNLSYWCNTEVSHAHYLFRAIKIGDKAIDAVNDYFNMAAVDQLVIHSKCKREVKFIPWSLDDLDRYLEILEQEQ